MCRNSRTARRLPVTYFDATVIKIKINIVIMGNAPDFVVAVFVIVYEVDVA